MSDFIQRIGPVERDIDPIYRVERARDEAEEREQQPRKRRPPQPPQPAPSEPAEQGPTEGDDGHLHIDIRA